MLAHHIRTLMKRDYNNWCLMLGVGGVSLVIERGSSPSLTDLTTKKVAPVWEISRSTTITLNHSQPPPIALHLPSQSLLPPHVVALQFPTNSTSMLWAEVANSASASHDPDSLPDHVHSTQKLDVEDTRRSPEAMDSAGEFEALRPPYLHVGGAAMMGKDRVLTR